MSPHKHRPYSIFTPPPLSTSELVHTLLDHDSTDILIDKWLQHRSPGHDAYHDWFLDLRLRKHAAQNPHKKQIIAWNKGDFVPENIFCRTVDTGRLIPLDRTWTTHVFHHHTMSERKLSMMPVVFTMLPELMLLRGMHDGGCDDIYIIVTDLKRPEMDAVTAYFQYVTQYMLSRTRRPSIEEQMRYEHMRLKHMLAQHNRLPCFPQMDLTIRAILHEKRPPFIILFSHQTTSYSQIFFTHPDFVPDPEIFHDYPTGCPNPSCTEECEMVRFPRRGVDGAAILAIVNKRGRRRKIKRREMCNWIECDIAFGPLCTEGDNEGRNENHHSPDGTEESVGSDESERDGAEGSEDGETRTTYGQVCGKCRLVRYCCQAHQFNDWAEHKRVCVKSAPIEPANAS